jgi:hypothetical protein
MRIEILLVDFNGMMIIPTCDNLYPRVHGAICKRIKAPNPLRRKFLLLSLSHQRTNISYGPAGKDV